MRATKWLEHQLLDPNDPRNASLLELLRARKAEGDQGEVRHLAPAALVPIAPPSPIMSDV